MQQLEKKGEDGLRRKRIDSRALVNLKSLA